MRRRNFIAFLGATAAWPLGARAQQPKLPTIGYLGANTAAAERSRTDAFVQRLRLLKGRGQGREDLPAGWDRDLEAHARLHVWQTDLKDS